MTRMLRALTAIGWFLTAATALAGEILVASASNFRPVMIELARDYESRTGQRVNLTFGSTGKQFAQIRNGAPFDAFFAADTQRPRLLEQEGLIVDGSRFRYAVGRLALWSPEPGLVGAQGSVLETGDFHHLAIANPLLAPYGRAAREVLENRGLWESISPRLVRGENIAQAFQFVQSGNAELGFVAWSQIAGNGQPVEGSYWLIDEKLHETILQQAVLLRDTAGGRKFMEYVRGERAGRIIRSGGYGIP